MRTKLSAFCDKVIEAGWLVILIVVPLFFNQYSNRIFEPDKLSLLRTIATFMAVAWLIRWGEESLSPDDGADAKESVHLWRMPLVLPTSLLALAYVLTTITSRVPRISLWGAYERMQGTYSTLSYMVIFFLMLQTLRHVEQLRRLVTVAILTSFPIALYGLLQRYGLDPHPWGGNVTGRVPSHMGNAIFISGYLIMIAPLTLMRIVHLQRTAFGETDSQSRIAFTLLFGLLLLLHSWVWFAFGFGKGLMSGAFLLALCALVAVYLKRRVAPLLLMGGYGVILSAQLVCILFSQSRGPLLGIAGGLFLLGLLYAFLRHRRTAAIVPVGAVIAVLLFLVIINVPWSPLPEARDLPYIGRMTRLVEVDRNILKARKLIWQGAVEMIMADPFRTVVGYGPETMRVAYTPFHPSGLKLRLVGNVDRAHNETFDALITTGLVGFAAYVFLFASTLYHGLRWIGLVRSPSGKRFFIICGITGGALGLFVPLIVDGSLRFAGAGLPIGFVGGTSIYVAAQALSRHTRGAETKMRWRDLLLSALFAGIVAHFIEIQFGIAVAATRTYFWAYMAILVLLGQNLIAGVTEDVEEGDRRRTANRGAPRGQRRARSRQSHRPQMGPLSTQRISLGILIGLMLITMAWDYTTNPLASNNPLQVLISSLTTMAAKGSAGETSLGVLWLGIATFVISICVATLEVAMHHGEAADLNGLLSSLGIIGGIAATMGSIFALIHAARLKPGFEVSNLIYEFYIITGIVWLSLGTALYVGSPRPSTTVQGSLIVLYPILLIACLFFTDAKNIRPIKADTLYMQGLQFEKTDSLDKATHFYQEAIDAAPKQEFYHLSQGQALMEKGRAEKDPERRDAHFSRSLNALKRARELNPQSARHTTGLARLYRIRAELEDNDEERREKLEKALQHCKEAVELSPHNPHIYTEMGDIYIARQEWDRAVEAHEKAVAIKPDSTQSWNAIGYAYLQMEDWERAIQANKKALAITPKHYGTLENLALLYREWGRPSQALSYAQRALKVAPQEKKQSMEGFIEELEADNAVEKGEE